MSPIIAHFEESWIEKAEIKFNLRSLMKDIDKRSGGGWKLSFLSILWTCFGVIPKWARWKRISLKRWLSVSWLPYLLSGCHTCPGCTFWGYIHCERSWQPLCLHITSIALRKVTPLLLLNCILISGLASLRGKFVPQNPRWVFFQSWYSKEIERGFINSSCL